MKPPRSLPWLRPALRALTSLREVSLAATASRPLWLRPALRALTSLREVSLVAQGALGAFGTAGRC